MAAPGLIRRSVAGLSSADQRAVLGGTAADVFGLDPRPATRHRTTSTVPTAS
jgi:hypothetical protein